MHLSWLTSARGSSKRDAAQRPDDPFELSAVDLFTTSGRRVAWIATNGRRTSDWLNSKDTLTVRGMQALDLDDEQAPPPLPPADATEEVIPADEVLFVIPPPLPPRRHLRLHRRRVAVRAMVKRFAIGGQAHIRPGIEIGLQVFRSGRRFVPLTDVQLVRTDEPALDWTLPVIIINSAHVAEFRGQGPLRLAPLHEDVSLPDLADAAFGFLERNGGKPPRVPETPPAQATAADARPPQSEANEGTYLPTAQRSGHSSRAERRRRAAERQQARAIAEAQIQADAGDRHEAHDEPATEAETSVVDAHASSNGGPSRNDILLTCLELLMTEGVIDEAEFDAKSAALREG